MTASKQLARDVATELGRRRRRGRLLVLALLALAIFLAVSYLTCGDRFGFGRGTGTGTGKGTGTAAGSSAAKRRCALRVTGAGVTVDGASATPASAVERCRAAGAADVVVTGDARQGAWDDLRRALEGAGVEVFVQSK